MNTKGALAVGLALACSLLSGCVSGPDSSANKFIDAARAGKTVEAGSYLTDDLAGADIATLLPEDAVADFTTIEEGPDAAKVISSSDERDYMLLSKQDGTWKVSNILFVSDYEDQRPVSFETIYTDDSSLWEGEEKTTSEGKPGLATYRVTEMRENGLVSNGGEELLSTDQEPVSATVTRGTKPRSAGWITVDQLVGWGQARESLGFRVTEIRKYGDGLTVTVEFRDARYSELSEFLVVAGTSTPEGINTPKNLEYGRLDSPRDDITWKYEESFTETWFVKSNDGSPIDKGDVYLCFGGSWLGYRVYAVGGGTMWFYSGSEVYPGPPL